MPAHRPSQFSTPASSTEPARPQADAPPSGQGTAAARPSPEGTLFHLLMQRGWDAELAYTADQRIHAMTSETAAAGLQPVLAEIRQIRETMAGFATKADLAGFATKADLAGFATKADLEKTETNLRREIAERDVRLIKWMFGALLAQAALVVGLVTLLK